jgi:hypothetical protein
MTVLTKPKEVITANITNGTAVSLFHLIDFETNIMKSAISILRTGTKIMK